jgi:serine/threonine protein kinase
MIIKFECPTCTSAVTGTLTNEQTTAECDTCGSECPIPNVGIVPGVVLDGGYRIDKLLEEKNDGDVYLGFQETVEREVQIKILPGMKAGDDEVLQRFIREVQLTASLQHANIVSAYHAGEDCGTYYLVTQYVEGKSLKQLLEEKGKISEEQVLEWLLPIAEALKYAWEEHKICHRNVKPENLVINTENTAMLTNMGIAKSVADDAVDLTGAGFTLGTPEYMSPEQVRGDTKLDFHADMYSLGVVIHECVAGSPPFSNPSPLLVMNAQLDQDPPPANSVNAAVSKRCTSMILKMLEKDRGDRPRTWDGLIRVMKEVMTGEDPPPSKSKETAAIAPDAKKVIKKSSKGKGGPQAVNASDVRAIAQEMYKKPSPVGKMLMYAMSVIIPIGLFFLIRSNPNPGDSTGTTTGTAGQVATGTQTPGTTGQAPADTRTQEIKEMFDYAVDFARKNPDDFDGSIRKFATVKAQATGTKYVLMADDKIAEVTNKKEQRVRKILSSLRSKADQLASGGDIDAAIAVYDEYAGPLASATAGARATASARLEARRGTNPPPGGVTKPPVVKQPVPSGTDTALQQRALDDAYRKAAMAVKGNRTSSAIGGVKTMLADAKYAGVNSQLKGLLAALNSIDSIDNAVLDSFSSQIGNPVQIKLKRESGEFTVKAVDRAKGRISLTRKAQGGSITFARQLSDLQVSEILKRLAASRHPNKYLCCGVVATKAGMSKEAKAYFDLETGPAAKTFAAQFK